MKVQLSKLTSKAKAGFSLVELLVVIAVIGILAAIAIPMIGRINDSAKAAAAKRNAQNLVSVYGAAASAGALFDTTSKGAIVTSLQTGVNGTGSFAGTKFQLKLSDNEKAAALAYVDETNLSSDGILQYTGANN
jgi:type IV pilus assembly protein PilA